MIQNIILKMIHYFGKDTRRINHALKVYGFASSIAKTESLDESTEFIIETTAILHDIGIIEAERKHHSSMGHFQEIEGPAIARMILEECNVTEDVIVRICFIIGHHHSYQAIDGIDFQILVEADFLVNIFEDEINLDSVDSIKNKYFKTNTGCTILDSMYGSKKKLT